MRGAVFDGSRLRVVDDLSVREPGAGEVLVRVVAAGLCHSDASVVSGIIPFPVPVVLGHEGAGVVERAGDGVDHVRPGDHVVLSTLTSCGSCPECGRGRPTMCRATFGGRNAPFTWHGEATYAFANTAVFAERTVVRASQVVRIDDDVPLESACLIGCAVLTGAGAALNRAKVAANDTAVVIGAGGIGLNVIQGCRLARAARIVAVDTNPGKEELARRFGATDFVDSVEAARELLPDGADHVFECVGSTALVRAAIDLLGWHGQCVLVGVPPAGAEASFPVASMYLDKSILGLRYGSSAPQADIPRYVTLYRNGHLLLDELVSRTFPLTDIDAAIADMDGGKVARAVLTM